MSLCHMVCDGLSVMRRQHNLHIEAFLSGDYHPFNRPEAKNALGRQLLRELREAVNNMRREHSTRCLVLKSAVPGTFCAGADLKVCATATATVALHDFIAPSPHFACRADCGAM